MDLLEETMFSNGESVRRIQLMRGDLAEIPPAYAVDALVVSAFPDDYHPTPGTLIAALEKRGVSVRSLAEHKDQDLRTTSSCWLSGPIRVDSAGFRRIICFEPLYRTDQSPAMTVGELFRSLIPLSMGTPWIRSVAMPLLATGRQLESPARMLRAIMDASLHWLQSGMDLDVVRIVIYRDSPDAEAEELRRLFRAWADEAMKTAGDRTAPIDRRYDLFISYSRKDSDVVTLLVGEIERRDPTMRIFRDVSELQSGSAWQREIFEAIDDCRHVVCLYSPDYLASKVCIEELHSALFRHREEGSVLIPAYVRSARLPSYLQIHQYTDVRESDPDLVGDFADSIIRNVRSGAPAPARSGSTPTASPQVEGTDMTIGSDQLVDLVEQLRSGGELRLDVRVRLAGNG